MFCGVLILLIRFFLGFALPQPQTFAQFASLVAVTQLVVDRHAGAADDVMLTRSPPQTLLLRRPRWATVPAAVLLAVALHPADQPAAER